MKSSKTWHSNDLETLAEKSECPIHHLAVYANHDETRYGFVLTDQEVIVVRTFYDNSHALGEEWQAISWDASGDGTLTPSLAVWFLVMMALNEEHRRVHPWAGTLPLNVWWRKRDSEGPVVY